MGLKRPALASALVTIAWCAALPAHGQVDNKVKTQESTALPDAEPGSERWIDWLSGGAASAGKSGQGRSQTALFEPTWLPQWSQRWQRALQALSVGQPALAHPLLKAAVHVQLLNQAQQVQPLAAGPLPWPQLACAAAPTGKLQVELQVLVLAETATGQATLGMHWTCRSDEKRWLRQVRLVVLADTLGNVHEAFGVRIDGPGLLSARSHPTAMPQWPLQAALLDNASPAWVLAGGRGWLVQVEKQPRTGWQSDQGLPTIGSEDPNQPQDLPMPQRQLWWLDRRARPQAVLLQGGQQEGRVLMQPLVREGVLDVAMAAAPGPLLLQRKAVLGPQGVPTRAGLWAWKIADKTADLWRVDLPALDTEGLWLCQPDAEERQLQCHFQTSASTPLQVDDLTLRADPAQRRWAPIPRK